MNFLSPALSRFTFGRISAAATAFLLLFLLAQFGGGANLFAQTSPAISQPQQTVPRAENSSGKFELSKERYEKAIAYSRAGYTLYFVGVAWSILSLVLLLRLRIIAALRDFASRGGKQDFLSLLIFVPLLVLLLSLLNFPLRIYGHHLSLRYEQSVQGWGSWFLDWCKGEALEIALLIGAAALFFAVANWKPRAWWLYFCFAAVPVAIFLFFITPLVIDPMFNKFEPLQKTHPQLVAAIENITKRAGVPVPAERMFLMEASRKTNGINAYVTGIGASKRVVVWDTSIQKTTPEELQVILGHELGHYVLNHVVKGFAIFLGGLLIGLYLTYWLLQWMIARFGTTWKIPKQTDLGALAVLLLIVYVISFISEPLGNAFSRREEHEADVYALEVTHGLIPNSQKVAANAFQVLGDVDLADPNPSPFIVFWLYTHPPLDERLRFAYTYDPWSKGEKRQFLQ